MSDPSTCVICNKVTVEKKNSKSIREHVLFFVDILLMFHSSDLDVRIYCAQLMCVHLFVYFIISDKIEYGAFTTPICNSTDTTLSAFKLINALCMGCVENVKTLQGLLDDLFYSGNTVDCSQTAH